MKRRFLVAFCNLITAVGCYAQITLDYCISKANDNYPLIKRFSLVEQSKTIDLADINKQWLPSASAYLQANVQNNVAEFPSALTDIMAQMGREMRGLGKFQYKVGVDISQTIWDGGASKAKREVSILGALEKEASLDVAMYAMHERVISIFFACLLISEQMMQHENSISLFESNMNKLETMMRDGTAMKSDVDCIKAQILTARQKLTEAEFALKSYRNALEIFIGESLAGRELVKPVATLPLILESNRPELNLFERQINVNNSKITQINASIMPKFGFFAQAFYGYPGFNNFEAMLNSNLSFNVLAGVKASWSLSPLYTKNNSLNRLRLANDAIAVERETFLFNSDIKTKRQWQDIEGLRKVMETDAEIVTLRCDVRKAAEVQLDNGIIDTFTLLAKISEETQAKLAATYHEIKLIKAIYQLKYTINR